VQVYNRAHNPSRVPAEEEGETVPTPSEPPDRALERYRAYLDCLTYIQVDPRLWRRFGWSDVVNGTLLEAHRERDLLEALDEADRNRRLRRMLMNNLLEPLILQKYHGWTQAQIAAHLGCTAGAVAGLHVRGLKRLRELLPDLSEEE
jgi:DNA-directed RNA polymerase specialized sigma24 family protein